jgi:hypothetical protein
MTLGTKDTKANAVDEYNSDTLKAINRALHYGSLVRPKATLAELAGLAANDNNKRVGE